MEVVMAWAYAVFVLWRAFARRPGFATWHMFTGATQFRMRLKTECGRPFDPWRYLPRSVCGMNEGMLRMFLLYLERIHGLRLSGTVDLRDGLVVRRHEIRNGRVVA